MNIFGLSQEDAQVKIRSWQAKPGFAYTVTSVCQLLCVFMHHCSHIHFWFDCTMKQNWENCHSSRAPFRLWCHRCLGCLTTVAAICSAQVIKLENCVIPCQRIMQPSAWFFELIIAPVNFVLGGNTHTPFLVFLHIFDFEEGACMRQTDR